jgi:cytochrome b561
LEHKLHAKAIYCGLRIFLLHKCITFNGSAAIVSVSKICNSSKKITAFQYLRPMQKSNKFSITHRLLHWGIAFGMIFMLITILLRLGWMNKFHVAEIILDNTDPAKVQLTEDEAIVLAKKIRKPMWEWHIYIGYVLTGLYVLRLIHMIATGKRFSTPWSKGLSLSEKIQSWAYTIFYALMGASLATGLLIEFGPDAWHETMEEIHAYAIWYLVGFIVLHLGGIVLYELGPKTGIVSKMIGGERG